MAKTLTCGMCDSTAVLPPHHPFCLRVDCVWECLLQVPLVRGKTNPTNGATDLPVTHHSTRRMNYCVKLTSDEQKDGIVTTEYTAEASSVSRTGNNHNDSEDEVWIPQPQSCSDSSARMTSQSTSGSLGVFSFFLPRAAFFATAQPGKANG